MPNEVKNYIVFNEHGKIKKHTIGDLYAGSHLVDAIYLFADFNISDAAATLMFRRSDGQLIGEVDCLPDNAKHPITGELVDCFSFVLGKDVLAVAGPLQITARYYYAYVIDGDQVEQVRATGMVTANVYETVPVFGGQTAVVANLNRKIDRVREDLSQHVAEYEEHAHDDRYYQQDLADNAFGAVLETDADEIVLKNALGTELSRIKIPTVVQSAPPGNLVFTGTGGFIIFDQSKKYVVMPIGSSTIDIGVYWSIRVIDKEPEELEYAYGSESPIHVIDKPRVFDIDVVGNIAPVQGLYRYQFDIDYKIDGAIEQKTHSFLIEAWADGIFLSRGIIRIGFKSAGYYQVYEME